MTCGRIGAKDSHESLLVASRGPPGRRELWSGHVCMSWCPRGDTLLTHTAEPGSVMTRRAQRTPGCWDRTRLSAERHTGRRPVGPADCRRPGVPVVDAQGRLLEVCWRPCGRGSGRSERSSADQRNTATRAACRGRSVQAGRGGGGAVLSVAGAPCSGRVRDDPAPVRSAASPGPPTRSRGTAAGAPTSTACRRWSWAPRR